MKKEKKIRQKSPVKSKWAYSDREVRELEGIVRAHAKKIKEYEKLIGIIERAKEMWQSTFDAIKDPVMIVSDGYVIERANLAASDAAGKDIRDIIGKTCYRLFAGRKTVCEGCPLKDVVSVKSPKVSRLMCRINEKDYEVRAFPLGSGGGSVNTVVIHYHDITEEVRLQQELMQQEKMAAIGMLAGGVAHELNNPLGGILAFCQLILRDMKEGNSLKGDIEEIERAAIRCKKIVADLLDFSRLSSGEKRWLDVNPLIENVLPFIRGELKSQNIELKTELVPNLPKVFGDANRIQQVILNLLTNACHAMEKGGVLAVKTAYDARNPYIVISVSDTGCGIAKENLSRVFDPFFTTKQPGVGTGLGLSICYRIVKDHRGTIEVKSSPNKGSTFIVKLPTFKEGGT